MNRTLTLPVTPWPELTLTVIARISDAQFQQAGVWQLQHVRLDLPLAMTLNLALSSKVNLARAANAAQTPWAALCRWLTLQDLPYQIAAARRDDIAVQLEFARYS